MSRDDASNHAGRDRWRILRRLLLGYVVWWVCFFVVALGAHSNGGVVSLPRAALAPIAPLLNVGRVLAEAGIWQAAKVVALSAMAPVAIGVAAAWPARRFLVTIAKVATAAYWLWLFNILVQGA